MTEAGTAALEERPQKMFAGGTMHSEGEQLIDRVGHPDDWDREFAHHIANADAIEHEQFLAGIERDFPPRPVNQRDGRIKRLAAVLQAKAVAVEQKPLPREWARDIRPQLTGLWRVKGLLPTTGLALIYGHSGAAKTFFAIDLAWHIALGWSWNGRTVKRGLVVYVAAEGGLGVRNRIAALKLHHKVNDAPLLLVPTSIDLQGAAADRTRLAALIRQAIADCGEQPGAIFVDTLSKTFGSGKENTDDMATYVANCQWLSTEFGTLVAPVHHRPKDSENEDPRGHGSLKGGVDTVILIVAGSPKRYRVTKQRDGELGEAGAFNLTSVYLGDDEDGQRVTSCVCDYVDAPASVAKSGRRLSDKQRLTLDALRRTIAEDGRDAPPGIPHDMLRIGLVDKVATLAAWRDRALAATASPDSKPDTLAKGFNRHVESLQAAGIVQVWEGYAWLPT